MRCRQPSAATLTAMYLITGAAWASGRSATRLWSYCGQGGAGPGDGAPRRWRLGQPTAPRRPYLDDEPFRRTAEPWLRGTAVLSQQDTDAAVCGPESGTAV